jgi:hypothetical protein
LTFSMTVYAIMLFANGRVLTRRIDQASATERG